MNILVILIPVSVLMGLGGLAAFVWTIKAGQYDDPQGDQARALSSLHDDMPEQPQAPSGENQDSDSETQQVD